MVCSVVNQNQKKKYEQNFEVVAKFNGEEEESRGVHIL
jgi:hypothetical protein